MESIRLYRRRYLPEELVELKDDRILSHSDDLILTKWTVLKPRKDIAWGVSAYYMKKGFKVSKIYDAQDQLVYWYCDIIDTEYREEDNTYVFCDLLIDVLVYPDGHVEVVDLDEFADIAESAHTLTPQLLGALRKTNSLLQTIYSGAFSQLTAPIDAYLS